MQSTTRTPAKVNLSLIVGPKDERGYHELFTVFVPIDLYDEIAFSLEARPGGGPVADLQVRCHGIAGEANLAARALRALEKHTGWTLSGVVEIEKRIPVAAGLGGGSSDAAAALLAGAEALAEAGGPLPARAGWVAIAREVGADVAFFLDPRPSIGCGIGEVLLPVDLPELPLVLVTSSTHLSTEKVYRAFDAACPPARHSLFARRAAEAEERWRRVRRTEEVAGLLENDLEVPAYTLVPGLEGVRESLLAEGALAALVSGSGPTLFGLCASGAEAKTVARRLEEKGFAARSTTASRGVREGTF